MSSKRSVIVAYDISSNKTRRLIYKILKVWRIDGQKSVHECRLTNRQAEELFVEINEPVDQDSDRLLMVWLAQNRKILIRGIARDLVNCRNRYGGESL